MWSSFEVLLVGIAIVIEDNTYGNSVWNTGAYLVPKSRNRKREKITTRRSYSSKYSDIHLPKPRK